MTDGTFKTWEMLAVGLGGVILMFSMFYEDMVNGHITRDANAELLLITVIVGAAGLFARPVWLLGNWKEIRTWERTTVIVRQSYSTGRGKGTRYHMYIEFFSKDGKMYHKWLDGGYAAYFKVGDKKDIMFAKEYMDALIFVPQAFRQAVVNTILGVLLESAAALCLIVL